MDCIPGMISPVHLCPLCFQLVHSLKQYAVSSLFFFGILSRRLLIISSLEAKCTLVGARFVGAVVDARASVVVGGGSVSS